MQKKLFNMIFILFIVFTLLYESLLMNEANSNEINNNVLTSKDAVLISLTDIEKHYGRLPANYKLLVEQEKNLIKVSLIWIPVEEGGSIEITIDRETGKIIRRIKGQ